MKLKNVLALCALSFVACGVAALNNTYKDVRASSCTLSLEDARSNGNANLLADSSVADSGGLHAHQAPDAFSFDSTTLEGVAKCDNRSIHTIVNNQMPTDYIISGGEKIEAKDLNCFYEVEFCYDAITAATYNHVGLVVGKDDSGIYHSIQFECYKSGAGDHRGFLFTGTSDQDGTTPIYTDGTAATTEYAVGEKVKMSIVKEGSVFDVYMNDNFVTSTSIEGLSPVWGIYDFGTYTTYSKACFKILNTYESVGKFSALDLARKDNSYVINNDFTIGGNLRGWSNCATASGNAAAFGANDGKDIRAFDQVDLTKAAIDDKLTDASALSVYYSAKITYQGKLNDYGALGLLLGKQNNGNSTKYVSAMIEPYRGHTLFYNFDVDENGTTTAESNVEAYLFGNCVHHALNENDSFLFEVLKVGNSYSVYFDGQAIIENYVTSYDDSSVGDNVIPMFGIASNFCQCTYSDLTFKVLDKGFSIKNVVIDEELVNARESKGVSYKGNLAVGGNIRGWSDCASASGDSAAFGGNDGKDVRSFVNFDYSTLRINGQATNAAELKVYYSADITYQGRLNDYGSIGLLLGYKEIGDNKSYLSLGVEPNRGHSLFYSFDVNSSGSTYDERNIENFFFNNGVHHSLTEGQTYKFEVIKDADTYSVYFDSEVVYKGYTGSCDGVNYTDGIVPTFGIYSNFVQASYENLEMKILTEGAETIDLEVEAARNYAGKNMLADEETYVSELLLNSPGFGGDKFDFDGSSLTGNAWCDDRTMRKLVNHEMYNTHVLIGGEKTSKSACDIYYSATFTYNQITSATYNHCGIVVGVDSEGVYHSIQLECYQEGSGEHRGFIFTGASNTLEVTPIYTDSKIAASDYTAGASWTMEVIKHGNEYKVYINGNYYVTAQFDNLVPEFGIYSFGTYAELSNLCCKIISEYEPYAADTTATLASVKINGKDVEGFDPKTNNYTVYAQETDWPKASDITVKTTSDLAKAEVNVNENVCTIVVTSESGDTNTYTITFAVPLSDDATLKSVKVLGKEVTVADAMNFSAPEHVSSIAIKDVEAVANDSKAEVSVTISDTVVTIKVTAESGTVKTYTINVTFNLSSDATLSSLKVKGTAVTGFDPNTTEYTVETSDAITAADIDAVAKDSYADVKVSGKDGSFKVTVTAENGTTKVYTVTVKTPSTPEGGCGSSIIACSALISLTAVAGLVLVSTKRKED